MIGKLFLALCFIFACTTVPAQHFGAFPPSTPWRQLDNDTAKIIFPSTVTPQAERISAIIRRMAAQNANSLGNHTRKINILLHPRTTLANGYVALAPFRSEYYLVPGSNVFEFGATPWIEELAVHEYRHVQQYSNFNKGLSKTAAVIFGQEGQALFNALAVPDWFFEGDAVHSETALTTQGRGRAPWFFNGFRALWYEHRNYSWMKLRNGSLKDFVPNHYNLGYLLANYGYLKYGSGFWGEVTNQASRFSHPLYPFQHAVKEVSGRNLKQFRTAALEFYQRDLDTTNGYERHSRTTVTDFLFPQQIGPDALLYIKTAYNHIPAFYLRNKSGEHRIKQRSITSEEWLSYRNGTVAYTGYAANPRWGLIDYSDIYLLNVESGTEQRITRKQKYFTPDLSPDGQTLVAVAFTDSATTELHLLNREGKRLQTISSPQNGDLFVHPRFASDESVVVAMRHADATMSLERLWLKGSGAPRFETLIPASPVVLGYPFTDGNTVYFVASASGNDEIYALDLSGTKTEGSITQLTSGVTGSYFPSVYNGHLVWSTFTADGFRIQQKDLASLQGKTIAPDRFRQRRLPYPVATDAATPNLLLVAGTSYDSTKQYKKTTGLFNFHSRQINYEDPEFTASIFSDNILNTFSNELFYRYNQNESSHALGFTSYYGGLFPVLRAGFTYTANRNLKTTTRTVTLNQKEARIGYYIPLNFTAGKTYKNLTFGTDYVYNETTPTKESKAFVNGLTSGYLSHSLAWSQQLPRAVQQIFPSFGYGIGLSHRHLLGKKGFQFLGNTTLYLPSIKNHSLVLTGNWQETDTSNVVFGNRFANSRGYNNYFFSRMWHLGGNYHLPLFYPDWGFGDLVYFLRVRGNAFYDYTRVYSKNKLSSRNQRSVGGEIYFDTRWWNMLPVSFGFRVSHLLDDDFSGSRPKGSNVFEVIVPVGLIPR